MELRDAVRFCRRWWWLLLLGPLVAGVVAFGWSLRQPAEYEAEATLFVNSVGEPGTLGPDASRGGQELARTYQELVVTWPVLEPIVQERGPSVDVAQLRDRVEAEAIGGTQLLRITASDSQPQGAADLANAIANSFVTYIGQQQAQSFRAVQSEIARQLDDIQGQIANIERQLGELEQGSSIDNPATTLTSLRAALDELQATRAQLLERRQEIDFSAAAAATHVVVATAARPPPSPSSPQPLLATVIGAFAGLIVVIGALVLREYLDDGRTRIDV